MNQYYSHGKLLLTGEYAVLDGALALAIPTSFGQSLKVNPVNESKIIWKSLDDKGKVWFKDEFNLDDNELTSIKPKNKVSKRLIQIIRAAKHLNPDFLNNKKGFEITTELEFPQNWGLGTSSTLINNIANWANVNAFELLKNTFGGSGYDIACAQTGSAITYRILENERHINLVEFNPDFSKNIFFIHLNKKQDSRAGIATYQANKSDIFNSIPKIDQLTNQIINCSSLSEFEELITIHETVISNLIKLKSVKDELFPGYSGAIKSLGAWGGDFILATGTLEDMDYFREKGFATILGFNEMIL